MYFLASDDDVGAGHTGSVAGGGGVGRADTGQRAAEGGRAGRADRLEHRQLGLDLLDA